MSTELSIRLAVTEPLPKALRDHQPHPLSGVTCELCPQCWVPVAVGMLDVHLRAIPHRGLTTPIPAAGPEG